MKLAAFILVFLYLSAVAAEFPPLPGFTVGTSESVAAPLVSAVAVAPPTNPPLVSIRLTKTIPQTQIIEIYVQTNRPDHWRIESCEDLKSWRVWSEWNTPSNRPIVPRLRDDAKLLDWFVVSTKSERYFRVAVLP